jgi:Domain of unknown function (DUF1963)
VAPIIRSARSELSAIARGTSESQGDALETWGAPEEIRTAARAPSRALSVDELIELAHSEGLTERDDALRDLAQCSLRMIPIDPPRADAWILTSDEWTTPGGHEVLAAQIDLAAAAAHQLALPSKGWLILFVGGVEGADDSDPRPAHGVVLDFAAEVAGVLEPMALGAELVIPRLWHEAAAALEFDEGEAAAYINLRARLHELQGVEDDDDGGPEVAYHRVLGYPNETTGIMPSECVRPVSGDSPESGQWLLLAQISVGAWRRLYIWIRDTDLELESFEQLCAFVR